jgi:hypothetical protein
MSNPGYEHWQGFKYLLRYLKQIVNYGLCFGADCTEHVLCGFSDSDFAGCKDSRKSTSAYYFTFAGSTISWKSQLQPIVVLSSTEAEVIATTEAIKEAIWLQGLMKELNVITSCASIFVDNQSAIYLCKDPILHDRSKHIDVKLHYIREILASGIVKLVKIATKFNPSDFGTKIVTAKKHSFYRQALQVLPW